MSQRSRCISRCRMLLGAGRESTAGWHAQQHCIRCTGALPRVRACMCKVGQGSYRHRCPRAIARQGPEPAGKQGAAVSLAKPSAPPAVHTPLCPVTLAQALAQPCSISVNIHISQQATPVCLLLEASHIHHHNLAGRGRAGGQHVAAHMGRTEGRRGGWFPNRAWAGRAPNAAQRPARPPACAHPCGEPPARTAAHGAKGRGHAQARTSKSGQVLVHFLFRISPQPQGAPEVALAGPVLNVRPLLRAFQQPVVLHVAHDRGLRTHSKFFLSKNNFVWRGRAGAPLCWAPGKAGGPAVRSSGPSSACPAPLPSARLLLRVREQEGVVAGGRSRNDTEPATPRWPHELPTCCCACFKLKGRLHVADSGTRNGSASGGTSSDSGSGSQICVSVVGGQGALLRARSRVQPEVV